MKVTQTVVRTTHATQEITVEVPDGSTDEQVRQALLEKAANTVFGSGNDADYQLSSEVGDSDGERAKSDVRWILDELVRLGFHTDESIDGAEAVEVMKVIFNDLTGSHRESPYEPCFIYSQQENSFWSQDLTWVDFDDATPFFRSPQSLQALEAFGVKDARIVTQEQADVISNYWKQGDSAQEGAPA